MMRESATVVKSQDGMSIHLLILHQSCAVDASRQVHVNTSEPEAKTYH